MQPQAFIAAPDKRIIMELLAEINWKHNIAAVLMGFVLSFLFVFLLLLSIKPGGIPFWPTFIYMGFILTYLLSRAESISKMLSWTLIILGLVLAPLHFALSEYDVNRQIQNQENAQQLEIFIKTSEFNLTEGNREFVNSTRNQPRELWFGIEDSTLSLIGFAGGVVLVLVGYALQRNNSAQSKRRKK